MKRFALFLTVGIALSACTDSSGSRAGHRDATSPVPSSPETSVLPDAQERPDTNLRFAVIGDFGSGNVNQISVAGRMCKWRKSHPFGIVITTGDNIYPDGSPDLFRDRFFRPYACLLRDGVRFHASLGNHDWQTRHGAPELNEPRFGMKGPNYVIRRAGVRFVIANSNEFDRKWLLRATRTGARDRWTVVAFHHPVLSPGLHGSTPGLQDLPTLLADRGVDLVLNGHDHLYAAINPVQGVRYVVTGGGGANVYPCLPSAATEVCEARHHFLYVSATANEITVQAVPVEGPPFDSFSTTGVD